MTSIVLTVALVIAIICDIIRIYQYVQMKRQNRTDVVNKIDRLHLRWERCTDGNVTFGEYCATHWHEE